MPNSTTSKFIPEWRLQEIRNIADTVVARAVSCLIGRLAAIAENELLKNYSHIRLCLNPRLKPGTAKGKVRVFENVECRSEHHLFRAKHFFSVTIQFYADIGTKDGWMRTSRALVRELGKVIFFSEASKKEIKGLSPNEKLKFLNDFLEEILSRQPFAFDAARPSFTIAKLRDIIENDLDRYNSASCKQEVWPSLQRLLFLYLGHDGR